MNIPVLIAAAAIIFAAGTGVGVKFHAGLVAQDALKAREAQESDARQQRALGDRKAVDHAGALVNLNNQLGVAREQIARLSGRSCLGAGTVSVLNATGVIKGGAAAGNPADPPAAAAAGTGNGNAGGGLRVSTDRDVAGYIALCRTRYAELAHQLNQILDIEERRHPFPP